MIQGATIHVLEGPLRGQSFPIHEPEMKIGREASALPLNGYAQISRAHARFFREGPAWCVQDLGSTNGTFVDNLRVTTARLNDNSIVKMGDLIMRVSIPGAPTAQLAPAPSPASAPTQVVPQNFPPQNFPQQNFPPQNYPQQSFPTASQYPAYPPAPRYPPSYPPYPPPHQAPASNGLSGVGHVMGIVAVSLMGMGLVPCLGWINWFTLSIGFIGFWISLAGMLSEQNPENRNKATIGLVLCMMANLIGGFRLILGGGVC